MSTTKQGILCYSCRPHNGPLSEQDSTTASYPETTWLSLYKCVWSRKSLKNKTKIQVYTAVVHTTLLYGSDTWVTYVSSNAFISAVSAPSSTFAAMILSQTSKFWNKQIPPALKHHLRWAEHVSRMEVHCLPKIALHGELSTGHRH